MKIDNIVLIAVGAVGLYMFKDTILSLFGKSGGTQDLPVCTSAMVEAGSSCRVANPFSLAPNIPVVPNDMKYNNVVLCALGIKDFCPNTDTAPSPMKDITSTADSAQLLGQINAGTCLTQVEREWAAAHDPTLLVLQTIAGHGCI